MDRKDSVPAVSQPSAYSQRQVRDTGNLHTLQLNNLVFIWYRYQLGTKFDA